MAMQAVERNIGRFIKAAVDKVRRNPSVDAPQRMPVLDAEGLQREIDRYGFVVLDKGTVVGVSVDYPFDAGHTQRDVDLGKTTLRKSQRGRSYKAPWGSASFYLDSQYRSALQQRLDVEQKAGATRRVGLVSGALSLVDSDLASDFFMDGRRDMLRGRGLDGADIDLKAVSKVVVTVATTGGVFPR